MRTACYSGIRLHIVDSGSRLIGGFITGQIIYLGVISGSLFPRLIDYSNGDSFIFLMALLMGASERFAPSIIERVEGENIFANISMKDI